MNGTPEWFMYFILFWGIVMIVAMAIGGFFMFRKFLKVLPKRDGKSKLDWQNYWVERSRPLWNDESKEMLDKLVAPVPGPFRDIAKHSIAAKIGEVAIGYGADKVTYDHCVEGYIRATPKRDYRVLMTFLHREGIEYKQFEHLINK
ncbi:DUF2621 family protein [Paenibacillus yanchengensis]|uniref:DUF2621 family protein n=1 Tax=Paenibacillus yanchengensis TaxID=2035833 RepID=A0ABW4YFH2_9BACL